VDTLCRNFQIFVGVGDVALPGATQCPQPRGDHVGNEFVFFAIPRKENGAGTAAAVEFVDNLDFPGLEVHFVLRHTLWPQETHHVRGFFAAQARDQYGEFWPR